MHATRKLYPLKSVARVIIEDNKQDLVCRRLARLLFPRPCLSPRAMANASTIKKSTGVLFVVLLIGSVLLVGALTYIPALALGPIAEHLAR